MRKFLIVLMMVAMVTFLFGGCIPITPEPDEDEEPVVLVGIAVEPETMELVKGKFGSIKVTACYELRGYEVTLDPEECLFLTGDSKVATVDEFGKVTAVGAGIANILVSYEGQTATLGVTVTYLPMEIKVDMPVFTAGEQKGFMIEIVANDDVDKLVKFYFTLPDEEGVTVLWFYPGDVWWNLTGLPTYNSETGEVVIGSEDGSLLIDEFVFFKATFTKAGTYSTTAEVWTVTGGEKDELLCSKVITAVVFPAPPG